MATEDHEVILQKWLIDDMYECISLHLTEEHRLSYVKGATDFSSGLLSPLESFEYFISEEQFNKLKNAGGNLRIS